MDQWRMRIKVGKRPNLQVELANSRQNGEGRCRARVCTINPLYVTTTFDNEAHSHPDCLTALKLRAPPCLNKCCPQMCSFKLKMQKNLLFTTLPRLYHCRERQSPLKNSFLATDLTERFLCLRSYNFQPCILTVSATIHLVTDRRTDRQS